MSDMNAMLDAEEEIMNLDDEYAEGEDNDDSKPSLKGGDDSNDQLNSSSNSLDKYVGKGRNSKYMTLLPEDFEPGELDVLCGRGKRCFNSPGNQRFRKLVASRADDYSAASTRTDKTFIVCSIVSEIRKASPKGGFVKKDSATGRWYEVGDFNAHEKTSQMFRDVLHENYLSSNKSKKKRRDLFRTNSKRRTVLQQQAQRQTINASSGRFLRANGVARHHSYGSARITAQQQASLMRMRQQARLGSDHSNAARADAWQNNSHSSWQNSWQNSFHSDAGLKSEPGMGMGGNPRAMFAQHRENSLGDLSGSIGELRVPDASPQQFHSSMGDFRFNDSFGEAQDNFHNSFGEFNTNGLGFPSANNNTYISSAGDINTGAFHESFMGPADYQNSFREYVNNDVRARAMASASPHLMNMSEPRTRTASNMMYRRANSADFEHPAHMARAEPDYDALDLQPPSVPLSISVPSEHPRSGIDREQFQLEFEPDENSLTRQRERQARENGLSIVDALDTAGYSNPRSDDNPFEPVPVEELPDDVLMQTMF